MRKRRKASAQASMMVMVFEEGCGGGRKNENVKAITDVLAEGESEMAQKIVAAAINAVLFTVCPPCAAAFQVL